MSDEHEAAKPNKPEEHLDHSDGTGKSGNQGRSSTTSAVANDNDVAIRIHEEVSNANEVDNKSCQSNVQDIQIDNHGNNSDKDIVTSETEVKTAGFQINGSCQTGHSNGNHDNQDSEAEKPAWIKKKLKRVGGSAERNENEEQTDHPAPKLPVSPSASRRDENVEPKPKPRSKPEWLNRKLKPMKASKDLAKTAEDAPESPSVRAARMRFEALNGNEKRRSFTTDDIDALKNFTNEVVSSSEDEKSNNHQDTSFLKKRPKPAPKPKLPLLGHNGKTSTPSTPGRQTNLHSTKKLTRSWGALTKDAIHPPSNNSNSSTPRNSTSSTSSNSGIQRCKTDTNLTTDPSVSEFQNVFSRMRQKILQRRESENSNNVSHEESGDRDRTLTRNGAFYVGSTNTGTLKAGDSLSNVSGGSAHVSFSDSDSDSEFESFSSCSDSETVSNHTTSAAQRLIEDLDSGTPRTKLYKKVYELLTTERAYVKRLELIQMFYERLSEENRKNRMFPDETLVQMFSNTTSICTFHQQHLLPALEARMKEWDSDPRLGDILSRLAPFLKIYSQYVGNYDSATKLIIATYQKIAKFKNVIDELQKLPECNHLALQHHMLEPIQRVPRYEMLVREYLHLLPDDSDDKEPTEKALQLVVTAAVHNNETLKKMERFHQLLQIHEQLAGVLPDVVSPTRQLIKQGRLTKVSRRNGALMERYIFLFNDMILVCSEQNMALTTTYRLHDKLSVEGMKTYNGDNPDLPNTFHVKSREKVIEFYVNDLEESNDWQATLWRVASDYMKKKKSFNKNLDLYESGMELYKIEDGMVGKAAPKWVPDRDASMCMVCCVLFTKIKRRHHCRACGILVCAKCSDYKQHLEYDDKIHRVCSRCYDILVLATGQRDHSNRDHSNSVSAPSAEEAPVPPMSPPAGERTLRKKKQKLLETKATDPSVISGYLNTSMDGRSWQKSWCAIHKDFVLYTFRGRQDIQAASSLALPGYELRLHDQSELSLPHAFSLSHAAVGTRYFDAADEQNLERWEKVLEKVLVAELPESEDHTQ